MHIRLLIALVLLNFAAAHSQHFSARIAVHSEREVIALHQRGLKNESRRMASGVSVPSIVPRTGSSPLLGYKVTSKA